MKKSKDHLHIDLDFLDKKESLRATPKVKKEDSHVPDLESVSSDMDNLHLKNDKPDKGKNVKIIYIIIGIVLFLYIFSAPANKSGNSGSSSTSSSNSTYTPTNNSSLMSDGGRTFSCSDSNYDRALELKPSSGTQLGQELDALNTRIDANKSARTKIEATAVDNTNQSSLDNYNYMVDSYNAERTKLISDMANWQQKTDSFDRQIDAYNNYLDTNCSPQ